MVLTVDFNHADPAISPHLMDWGTRLRAEPGLAWSEHHGGFWVVARHADVLRVLRQPDLFICSRRITLPPQASPVPVIPLESDEPDHAFYRSVFDVAVSPRKVASFEAKIRQIVTDALDPLIARGTGDAVGDFAARIPTRAMAALVGMTDEDAYRTDAYFTEQINAAGSGDPERLARAVDAYKGFLNEKLDERRRAPQDDLITAILNYEQNGRRYNADECLGLMWSAAGGAIDTTKHSIGHVMHLLGTRPDLRKAVIDQPRLIPLLIEESLRINPPSFAVGRYVARDTELAGTAVKQGQRVLIVYGFANRDGSAFAEPDAVVIDRPPSRMLTFGNGIHQCVGMHLGRFEVKIAVEEVLRRMPDFVLKTIDARPTLHGGMMWAHDSLPMAVAG